MPTNKHAIIRYDTLDRCFSNFTRRYYIEDLIQACNNALRSYSDTEDSIHRHQVYNDILFMEDHWHIPLQRLKDGKRIYYRYEDRSYSFRKRILKDDEVSQVAAALSLLRCFEGLPNYEWILETDAHFRTTFQLPENISKGIVEFQHNPFIRGLSFFPSLFNAIIDKSVLEINYCSFGKEARSFIVHPYFLKEYSSRWYLLSLNDEKKQIITLALDRIITIKRVQRQYIKNQIVDFEDYFYDAIGITVPAKKDVLKVQLKINNKQMPYVTTRPIHGSQRIIRKDTDFSVIELEVYDTFELRAILLSFGRNAEVLAPEIFRKEMAEIIQGMSNMYK